MLERAGCRLRENREKHEPWKGGQEAKAGREDGLPVPIHLHVRVHRTWLQRDMVSKCGRIAGFDPTGGVPYFIMWSLAAYASSVSCGLCLVKRCTLAHDAEISFRRLSLSDSKRHITV